MRSHAKASSAGSTKRQATAFGRSLLGIGGSGALARLLALVLSLLTLCCLLAAPALAETRLQIDSFGPDGTNATQFGFPGAIAVDQGTHDIYVADYEFASTSVEKFNENHVPSNFSALGTNELVGFGFFFSNEALQQIAVSPTSHAIYVVEYGGGRIRAFQQSGAALNFTAGPDAGSDRLHGNFCGVAVDANGLIYTGDYSSGVRIFKPDGEELTSFHVAEEPCNVAVDSNGAVYVSHYPFFGQEKVEKFTPDEFPVTASTTYSSGTVIDPNATFGITVDPSSNDLYLDYSNHVSAFDSSGSFLYEFANGISSSEGIAVDGGTEKAYVSNVGDGQVRVFGPPVPLPKATTEDADEVTTTSATLRGTVDPEGEALSDCRFEAVPASQFATDEYASVTLAEEYPCVPSAGSIPADSNPHEVEAEISGLSPSSTYHFRLLAENVGGTAEGLDRTLITGPPTIAAQTAEAIGTTDAILSAKINPKGIPSTYHVEYGPTVSYGQSTPESSPIGFAGDDTAHSVSVHVGGLQPGTAYHFRFVATSSAGEGQGTDATFATYPASPVLGSCPNEEFRTGFGERLPDCRAYEQASPVDKHGGNVQGHSEIEQASSNGDRVTFYLTAGLASSGGSSTFSAFVASRGSGGWSSDGLLPLLEPGLSATIVGWSDDLSTSLDEALSVDGGIDFYLREGSGTYRLIAHDPERAQAHLGAFAADTTHLTFEARGPLLPGAAAGKENLYKLDNGTLTLPGRIPVGPATSCDDEGGPACVLAPEGAFLSGQGVARRNSISRDGSKVYFTDRASGQLYVREDGIRTTQVSASQKTNGSGPGGSDPLGPQDALVREATPDGAHVFFTSPEELTDDADTGVGPAIGRSNLDGTGADQSFRGLPATASGVAVDGSHLYWVNTNAGTIARANLDGTGMNESFIAGANKPQYVAVDGSHVYWTNAASGANGAGTIGRANLDGTGVEQSFITGASNPRGIAVDGAHIYWANAGTTAATRAIARANLDGTSPEQSFVPVTEGTKGPTGVAVNSSFIYWGNPRESTGNGGGSIGRATIAGASPDQSFVIGASLPGGLALDGSYLYWANNNESGFARFGPAIGRVKLDGSERDRAFIHTAASVQGVALDGSHLYWAAGDARDTGNDLYRYDDATGDLVDLSADSNSEDPKGAEVRGFIGASADGFYAYFVADGVLAPGAPPGGLKDESGFQPVTNLYLAHAGTVKFVAQLEASFATGDVQNWSLGVAKTSRVADDGTLVFSSERVFDLSGHDHGAACKVGGCATEFYRYTPADEGLACITCSLTGPASSQVSLASGPGTFIGQGPGARVNSRNLSADGKRFFFETSDALVSADTNGVNDVYEWEARGAGSCESESQNGGCIYLISSGTGPEGSHLLDASASGDDVFFFTEQSLVPADGDELVDVYDASVGGGLASQHQLTPPTCASTACQANPAPPPDPSTASSSYRGAGNVHKAPSAHRCPKGKRRVRRKGKVRCQKAAKHHKRHSNRGGAK